MSDQNVFDSNKDRKAVPVKVVVDGKEVTVGEANLTDAGDGIVHVDMNLKTNDPDDVINLFGNGITGYSMQVVPEIKGAKHVATEEAIQMAHDIEVHDHKPVQHRDGKPAWCPKCHLTADYQEPTAYFNFGKPANPLRGGIVD